MLTVKNVCPPIIFSVSPPTSLTVEQEIARLEGGGDALESEIDELRRAEMDSREFDSMHKGSGKGGIGGRRNRECTSDSERR